MTLRPYSIPQTDPRCNYLSRKNEIESAIHRVLESGRYILGPEVENFEREFAAYIGVKYAVGVGSGTDAIEIALRSCGIKHGDIVLTVSHTAVATIAAIERCGATPFFIDIDPATYCMDANKLQYALSKLSKLSDPNNLKAKAVIPVHLYGHPADIGNIKEIARHAGLFIIEDCAQAHGSEYEGKKVGCWGNLGAFSFYPTKNIGALGDGGIVVTDNIKLYRKSKMLREYGWKQRYSSELAGINSRLDEIQAAVLRVKLKHLDEDNSGRQKIADLYRQSLDDNRISLPRCSQKAKHVYHQFVIYTKYRDRIQKHLNNVGIGTLVHYPLPVHLQPAYKGRIQNLGGLDITENVVKNILSLPMFPELREEDASCVCHEVMHGLSDNV